LRTLADVTDRIDREEQRAADEEQERREPPQERGLHLRERAHGDAAERDENVRWLRDPTSMGS
jgi:hypothetical protein